MIELPELSILLILDHLSYEDLQSLRVTCKKLKAIVDQRTPQSLHLLVDRFREERELLHTGELVSYANTFQAPELTILRSAKFRSLFTGLRKLTIYKHSCFSHNLKTVDPDDLNYFQSLVHLQLENVEIKNGKLSLRNLRIASLQVNNDETADFELDCPQLQVLGLGYQTRPKLTQETANSIRYLYNRGEADGETSMFLLYAKLNNLSTICFDRSERLNSFVVALMEHRVTLSSLKQIQLKRPSYFTERGVLLRNLAELKRKNETKHLEVLINGKVMERNELTELLNLLNKIFSDNPDDPADLVNRPNQMFCVGNLWKSDLLRHFHENPILHCLLPSVYWLVIWSDEDVRLSKQLIGRLQNLAWLTIYVAMDEQYFEFILRTCRRISNLQIYKCPTILKQQQLDQMPDYLQNLTSLSLGSDMGRRKFNFHFLIKFKKLNSVRLDFNIPKETMSSLFCNNLKCWLIFSGTQYISIKIWRNKNGQFEIRCYNSYTGDPLKIIKFDCVEEAIEHYYRNDLFNTLNTPWDWWRTAYDFKCALI